MNKIIQNTVGDLSSRLSIGERLSHYPQALKVANALLKILLAIIGLWIGGLIGLFAALLTGLINFDVC